MTTTTMMTMMTIMTMMTLCVCVFVFHVLVGLQEMASYPQRDIRSVLWIQPGEPQLDNDDDDDDDNDDNNDNDDSVCVFVFHVLVGLQEMASYPQRDIRPVL
jgi:hypothetical protein